MSIEGQGHFFTIYFPGFVCFVLYLAKISGERLQDHWSSGLLMCYFPPENASVSLMDHNMPSYKTKAMIDDVIIMFLNSALPSMMKCF